MNSYNNILNKLSDFTKKYYTKLLLKGLLLFLSFGLLFFLVILGIEYFLWLNSTGRLILLLVFVGIEAFLLFKYILTPLFYLFKLKKGISHKQASLLIGRHFSDVDDKLYNLLDLAEDKKESELLMASIEQRSRKLDSVPFTNAVNLRDNLKYAKYLIIPVMLFCLIWLSGNLGPFFGSSKRIVNYEIAYTPPALFEFRLLSNDLDVLNDKPYTIMVSTEGQIRPEAVHIAIDGKRMLLQENNGIFQYTLNPPLSSTDFYFEANEVSSRTYSLKALETPSIHNFELKLDYPRYINRKSEVLKSTGNATFPEGTKVTWKISAQNTEEINLISADTTIALSKNEDTFEGSRRVYSKYPYELSTSNKNVVDYEKLVYEFNVIKDAYPSIKVKEIKDTLNPNTTYFSGEVSDDYGLVSIDLVYYADDAPAKRQKLNLKNPNNNFDHFYYTFPTGLDLEVGKSHSYYFEVTDNDAIRKGKKAKSQLFSTTLLNDDQLKNKELQSQQSIIQNLDKSLEKFKEQKVTLSEINIEQKEKKELNYNDQSQIKDFLKKQEQQENMMQKFSKQLKESLEKNEKDDKMSELLKERLERQEIEAKKNEKLLQELNKIADKIDEEDLKKRLEELAKNQQSSERNLEQLVELTKRYYVTEKAAQLATELKKLAKKQEKASEGKNDGDKVEEQNKLSEDFEELSKELKGLQNDNEELKKPLDLDIENEDQESVKEDQSDAEESLKESESEGANPETKKKEEENASRKQKSAAQKMNEMSEKLSQSSAGGGGGSTISEDAEMLRQILDNLITFSFKQENLFSSLEGAEFDMPQFSGTIKKQQELRQLFEHIDDSLFALSLRRAELSEFVNEQITEVYYNTDKALESIAENQMFQGIGYQKYVITAANSLSDFLANVLDNMQESMQSGQGEGQGKGFQLPDIIKSQSELKEKMDGKGKEAQGKKEGNEGQAGQGKKPGQGESEGEGQSGKSGKSGSGQSGNDGEGGDGKEGDKNGKEGKSGQGKEGKEGSGNGGNGNKDGLSEEELKEIFEIYKEQQAIRERLEEQLKNMLNTEDRKLGEKLVRQMEDFENELLENGITHQGKKKMNTIQYELMKLRNAAMKQGKKQERESYTNKKQFDVPVITRPEQLNNISNEIEILNREALPLRRNHQNRVKLYFKGDD